MKTAVLIVVIVNLVKCQTNPFLPNIVDILKETQLPEGELCSKQMELFLQSLQNRSLNSWGLKMLDSWSKIPSGIFSLNFGELGSFDQCIELDVLDAGEHFKGKYCLGAITLLQETSGRSFHYENSLVNVTLLRKQQELARKATNPSQVIIVGGPSVAVCVPDGCSQESVQLMSDALLTKYFANLTKLLTITYSCQGQEDVYPELTTEAIITICFLSIITSIMILSTVCDLYYHAKNQNPPSQLLVAFSVYTNGRKLFRVSRNSAELSCLSGIKVLSMAWVVLGHSAFGQFLKPLVNMASLLEWIDSWHSMIFVGGTLAVDSFFVVGGLLVVYSFMKATRNNIKFNLFMFYFHRYIRLTPALAAAVLVNATLLKYLGSGPNWHFIEVFRQNFCKESWWRTILYIQNYVEPEKICMTETWYLDIDMQLYLFAPIFLFVLSKHKKIGSVVLELAIVVFMVIPFAITWVYKVPALITNVNGNSADFNYKYYYTTHTRAATWFIGALAGYFIAEIKFEGKKVKISKILKIVIWVVVLAIFATCIFSGHSTLRGEEYNRWGNALYNTFVKPAWGMCVAWVIFACVTGNADFVNGFLSLPIFQVLNRFTYSMYLLHLSIICMISLAYKSSAYFSLFNIFYQYWGTFVFTFALSVFWTLAFESPVLIIEKVLLRKDK